MRFLAFLIFIASTMAYSEEPMGFYALNEGGPASPDVRTLRFGLDFKPDGKVKIYRWFKTGVEGEKQGENMSISDVFYKIKDGMLTISESQDGVGESVPITIGEDSISIDTRNSKVVLSRVK